MDGRSKIQDFRKRWNIDIDIEDSLRHFKNIIMNSFQTRLFKLAAGQQLSLVRRIAFHFISYLDEPLESMDFSSFNLNAILGFYKKADNDTDVYLYTEAFVNAIFNSDRDFYDDMCKAINQGLEQYGLPIQLIRSEEGAIICPAGAEELDKKLVSEVLSWLNEIPNARSSFEKALKLYSSKHTRSCLDELRKALEFALRYVLNNRKGLENQTEHIKSLFTDNDVDVQIKNLFFQIFNFYIKYQNENVKHGNTCKFTDIEFILYQTGVMLRFLLQLYHQEKDTSVQES